MPKALGRCEICDIGVMEVGAYVKIALKRYAHLHCYGEMREKQGRLALLQEQREQQEQERLQAIKAREEQAARERAEAERRLEIQERERTNRAIAAKNMPLPAKLVLEPKKQESKEDAKEKPDRFKLIETE